MHLTCYAAGIVSMSLMGSIARIVKKRSYRTQVTQDRSADRSEMLFPGEKEAIQTVLALGAKYGYGNLIAHLRRAWALSLKSKYGGTYEQHLPATNSDAYPENLGIE